MDLKENKNSLYKPTRNNLRELDNFYEKKKKFKQKIIVFTIWVNQCSHLETSSMENVYACLMTTKDSIVNVGQGDRSIFKC